MRSVARAIADHLVSNAVGTFGSNTGWAICVGIEQKQLPNTVVTVYDTGGSEVETDEQDVHRPSFQIRVRTLDYEDGYAKQDEIRALLLSINNTVIFDIRFLLVTVSSDIAMIQRDDNDRCIFTANYICVTQPT